MKNGTLNYDLKGILANPKVIITKGDVSGNSIEICVNEPSYIDLGSFTYYGRVNDRDSDFNELIKLKSK